jgi:hypothetical protein
MEAILIYSVIFNTIKFIICLIFLYIWYDLILGIAKDYSNQETKSLFSVFKTTKNKVKIIFAVFFTFLTIGYLNVEPAHRPKVTYDSKSMNMRENYKSKEIVKEDPNDFDKKIEEHRKENKKIKENFKEL